MAKKHTLLTAKAMQTLALGMLCAIGAFGAGIETAGDVHPFARSEAALQELMMEGASQLHGDINGDGKINGQDAYLLYQIVEGLESATPDQIRRGDTNGDGQLNAQDLSRLLHTLSIQ